MFMIRALLKVSEPNCEVQPATNYSHDKTTITREWQNCYFSRWTKGSISHSTCRILQMYIYWDLLFRKENQQSSFPKIHKVDNVGIFVLLQFENKLNGGINYFNISSKYHDKCKFALKLILFLIVCNLFPLEVVQKWQ